MEWSGLFEADESTVFTSMRYKRSEAGKINLERGQLVIGRLSAAQAMHEQAEAHPIHINIITEHSFVLIYSDKYLTKCALILYLCGINALWWLCCFLIYDFYIDLFLRFINY